MSVDLVRALLETEALRLAPAGSVFWYTSGTVGPYYINTENLYGGPAAAADLLAFIDVEKANPRFAFDLRARVLRQYEQNAIYRHVVDALVARAQDALGGEIDAVSGGERRDWFFSLSVAECLGKPNLLIFKNRKKVLFDGEQVSADGVAGLRTLHVADLVTEASSYFRDWIPLVGEGGGQIVYSANVVDRGQGGIEALCEKGVPSSALLRVDEALFARLLEVGHINAAQAELLTAYYRDPHAAMRAFLVEHPHFLQAALQAEDARTRERAQRLVDEDLYGLNK